MKLLRNSCKISEGLSYHITHNIPLCENIFRHGSDEFYELIREVRALYMNGFISFDHPDDSFIVERLQTGTKAKYKDRDNDRWIDVKLDDPWVLRGDKDHKFGVYIDTGRKNDEGEIIAKFLGFGDPNAEIANDDDGRRKSFLARHKCDKKKDKTKAGFWSCNVHLFWKQLNLKSDNPW